MSVVSAPYFVSPVVAGLDPKTGAPFICGFDSIGCIDFAKDFIVSGTASEQLFGMCESLWEPDLVRPCFLSLSLSLPRALPLLPGLACWFIQIYNTCGTNLKLIKSPRVEKQGPDDLFETISQALLSAVDRDALSGWGAHVYVIEKNKVTKRLLKGRQD